MSRRASSTSTTTSTRRSRARAQGLDLFTWLKTLYPAWAGIDEESVYSAARTGLAELALSGCTTVFDHHYVFPRGTSGLIEAESARALKPACARRVTRLDGPRRVRRRPAARLARRATGRHDPRRDRSGSRTCRTTASVTQIAVAPCSPFSVTGKLMEESAQLARRLGLVLHTHLAETAEEALLTASGCTATHAGLNTSARSAGSTATSGARTASTSRRPTSRASRTPAPASRTARPRTSASARASRRCATCSTPACASASASTARRRTSAATCSSR